MSKKNDVFVPYANESDVLHIGGLDIENRVDRLILSGDCVISRDRQGLADLRALHFVLGQALSVLEADRQLPLRLVTLPPVVVPNPFA